MDLPLCPKNMPYYCGPRIWETKTTAPSSDDLHIQLLLTKLVTSNEMGLGAPPCLTPPSGSGLLATCLPVQRQRLESSFTLSLLVMQDRHSSLSGRCTCSLTNIFPTQSQLGTCHSELPLLATPMNQDKLCSISLQQAPLSLAQERIY
jgi:hypothetical protein